MNKFLEHLDNCRQCRENPFDLCLTGHALLHEFPEEQEELESDDMGYDLGAEFWHGPFSS